MTRPDAGGPIRTAEQAGAWLEGLINVERLPDLRRARLTLGPVRRLLARVGEPQRALRVVHVAGSKGKGSTALLAEALLREAGRSVGTFTSPHLERWTERFRLDGAEVAGERLAAAVERIRPHVEALRREAPEDAPSFFDATTAAAFLLFAEAGVDEAVIEVGLGGRLDSTNVVGPAVTCITTVELEHTEKLGSTRAAIAAEKAGIAKAGVPLVTGTLAPEAAAVVAERARAVGAPERRLGRDFFAECLEARADGLRLRLRTSPEAPAFEAELASAGAHQAENAACALACVERLGVVPEEGLPALARAGFARAALPGRVELLARRPWVVVDAAHTAASAAALARALAALPRRRAHLVLSVSSGKDVEGLCRALLPGFDAVTVTCAEPVRSLGPQAVREAVRSAAPELDLRVVPNPQLALRAAREGACADELLCAAGSIYLAGLARRLWAVPPAPLRRSRRASAGARGG